MLYARFYAIFALCAIIPRACVIIGENYEIPNGVTVDSRPAPKLSADNFTEKHNDFALAIAAESSAFA